MIGPSRIKRAISAVPPGGMQTGDQKVKLRLCDAQRIEVEYAALIAERDAALAQNAELVAQVKKLKNDLRQTKLIHIGFTNESQVHYVTEDKEEGSFYPDSDNGCYIPVYMLNIHAHRVGPDSTIYCTQIEQSEKISELERQAAELVAQVEYLKFHFNELAEVAQRCDSWELFPQQPIDRALGALQSMPNQCLRHIQADAVLSAIKFFNGSRDIDVEGLESYAARVKAGE